MYAHFIFAQNGENDHKNSVDILRFFREKASLIGWSIVLIFGGTMFAGSLFLGGMNLTKKKTEKVSDVENRFALLGNTPVYQKKYLESRLQNYQLHEARNKDASLTPDMIERLEYDAFSTALRFTVLLESATPAIIPTENITVSVRRLGKNLTKF